MKTALDANWYSDFCRGIPEAVASVQQSDRIYLPFIVLGELRAGFASGNRARKNERTLGKFLLSPRCRCYLRTSKRLSIIFNQLRQQATPIPTNDLWIAALVIQHNLVLLSRDSHFDFLPQICALSAKLAKADVTSLWKLGNVGIRDRSD